MKHLSDTQLLRYLSPKGDISIPRVQSEPVPLYKVIAVTQDKKIQAAIELSRRVLASRMKDRPFFKDTTTVKEFLSLELSPLDYESFACFYLDKQHKLIEYEVLFRGTIDSASVYPREVAKRSLETNAAAIVIGHNHPSGKLKPSAADISLTWKIRDALNLLDIQLLDHILVAAGETMSFAESGHL